MKNARGVTIASLTIYVVVAVVVISMLAFININFINRIKELTVRVDVTDQYDKFCSFFVSDVKSSDKILEYSDKEILFKNGVHYEIKKRELSTNTYEYAIYRNDVVVCDGITYVAFDYDYENSTINVEFKLEKEDYVIDNVQGYVLGQVKFNETGI